MMVIILPQFTFFFENAQKLYINCGFFIHKVAFHVILNQFREILHFTKQNILKKTLKTFLIDFRPIPANFGHTLGGKL